MKGATVSRVIVGAVLLLLVLGCAEDSERVLGQRLVRFPESIAGA